DPHATAIVGADRYQTALFVAERLFGQASQLGVASGESFPDALSGGANLGTFPGPVVLVQTISVTQELRDYVKGRGLSITGIDVFGGTAAVSKQIADTIRDDANPFPPT